MEREREKEPLCGVELPFLSFPLDAGGNYYVITRVRQDDKSRSFLSLCA